jgi:hypothetical protein
MNQDDLQAVDAGSQDMFEWLTRSAFCAVAGVVMQTGSCLTSVSIDPEDSGEPTNPPAPASRITVRFANQTASALDVQFYASASAVGTDLNALFAGGNQITMDIGFAGTGLIAPNGSDEITLDCVSAVTIGTRGGRFVNSDSGQEVATGQQRVASMDLQYNCGDRVTWTFLYSDQAQAFTTTLLVD